MGTQQDRHRSRGLDVPASSQKLMKEVAERQALESIASRLHFVEKFCEESIANQNKQIADQHPNPKLADLSQLTEAIQTDLPLIIEMTQTKKACSTLTNYIEREKSDKDLSAETDQIIRFLEARSRPGTENTDKLRLLADDIKRNRHLFTQQAQREVAQAPSSSRDKGKEKEHDSISTEAIETNESILHKIGNLNNEEIEKIYISATSIGKNKDKKGSYITNTAYRDIFDHFKYIRAFLNYQEDKDRGVFVDKYQYNSNNVEELKDKVCQSYRKLEEFYNKTDSKIVKNRLKKANFDFAQ